jgi:hypothetical protein
LPHLAAGRRLREIRAMATTRTRSLRAFVDAVVTRDFAEAQLQLHPQVDFRGMTPNRIWEADAHEHEGQVI